MQVLRITAYQVYNRHKTDIMNFTVDCLKCESCTLRGCIYGKVIGSHLFTSDTARSEQTICHTMSRVNNNDNVTHVQWLFEF